MTTSNHYVVTAAIDFGTSYSGYAYSYQDEKKIYVNANWKDGSQSFKVPTAILFDGKKKFKSFGYAAEDDFLDQAGRAQEHEYMLFRYFKMELYKEKNVTRNLQLKATNGKCMNALDVFSAAISFLKDHLLDSINIARHHNRLTVRQICWVLTVPAIWSETSKSFMKEAAKMAGINKDDLLIALEPECASIYCKNKCFNELPSGGSNVGTKYMVIDIGSGTVDLTIHEIQKDGAIREIQKATGDNLGGNSVDKRFENFLGRILTVPVIEQVKKSYPADWLDFKRDFQSKKRSLSNKVTLKLKPCFNESYKAFNECSISEALLQGKIKQDDVSIPNGNRKLKINQGIIENMILGVTFLIKEEIKKISNTNPYRKLDYVILAGGFSNSSIVLNDIQKFFDKVPVVRPEEAELTVLRGAVLYGLKPNQIIRRISRRTYGIRSTRPIKAGDPEHLLFVDSDGKKSCEGVFDTLVTIDESVHIDHKIEKTYIPVMHDSREMVLLFYGSKEKIVRYCDDIGVYKIGKLTIQIPNNIDLNQREVKVEISFGNTTTEVQAKNKATDKTVKATFDFLSK